MAIKPATFKALKVERACPDIDTFTAYLSVTGYSRRVRAMVSDLQSGHYDRSHRDYRLGYDRGADDRSTRVLQATVTVGGGWGSYSTHTGATYIGGDGWRIDTYVRNQTADLCKRLGFPVYGSRVMIEGAPDAPTGNLQNRYYPDPATPEDRRWVREHTVKIEDCVGLVVTRAGVKRTPVVRKYRDAYRQAETDLKARKARLADVKASFAANEHLIADGWAEHIRARYALHESVQSAMGGKRMVEQARAARAFGKRDISKAIDDARKSPVPEGYSLAWRKVKHDDCPAHYGPQGDPMIVGQRYSAPDWDARPSCGGGIHSCAEWEQCSHYVNNAPILWAVAIPDGASTVDAGGKNKSEHVIPLSRVGIVEEGIGRSPRYYYHRPLAGTYKSVNEVLEAGNLIARLGDSIIAQTAAVKRAHKRLDTVKAAA